MRRSIGKHHFVRRVVTPLFVGCMAFGVPAFAVLGSPSSAGAATTAAASSDPLGPTLAQVDEEVAIVDDLVPQVPGLVEAVGCIVLDTVETELTQMTYYCPGSKQP